MAGQDYLLEDEQDDHSSWGTGKRNRSGGRRSGRTAGKLVVLEVRRREVLGGSEENLGYGVGGGC